MDIVLLLSLPVACVSWTICEAEILRDFREALKRWARAREGTGGEWLCQKLAYVPTCYYCTSHWISALFTVWAGAHLVGTGWLGR